MQRKLIFLIFAVSASAFGQALRVDVPLLGVGPNVPSQGGPTPQALLLSNSTIALCNHPSSLSSCTPVTTYTDSAEDGMCPPTQPLTQNLSTVCTANTGTTGRVSFWYGGGNVDYYVTNSSGYTQGPYTVSSPGSGSFIPTTGGPVGTTGRVPDGYLWVTSNTCKATGNGTTDDTTDIQTCITYAIAHGYLGLYFPTGQYLVTQSLNATASTYLGGLRFLGEGRFQSVIIHELTEAYPVLDVGGMSFFEIADMSISPPNWPGSPNYSLSQATAAILATPGPSGGSYGSNFRCKNADVIGGNTATQAAALVDQSDLTRIENCNFQGGGAGLVIGSAVGTATGVVSKFYTMPVDGADNFDTLQTIVGGSAEGGYIGGSTGSYPALEMTGQDQFVLDSFYMVIGGGTGPVWFYNGGIGQGGIRASGCRTESNSPATGVTAFEVSGALFNSDIKCSLNTDSAGYAVTIDSGVEIRNSRLTINGGAVSGALHGAGSLLNSDITLNNYNNLGTLSGTQGDLNVRTGANMTGTFASWCSALGAGGAFSSYVRINGALCPSANNAPSTTSIITVTAAVTISGATSGYYFNQEATAGTAVTYTLPTPAEGNQFCVKNSNNGSAADTGVLELLVANTGTQSIIYNGTKSTSGYLSSAGAAGDFACVVGISATQWEATANVGSWSIH